MTVRARLGQAILDTVAYLAEQYMGGVEAKATSADEDIDVIRADYAERLFEAFMSYLQTGSRRHKNEAGGAVVECVIAAFERGIEDGGGDRSDIDREDSQWATAKQNEQVAYLDGVFDWLKDLRENDTATEDSVQARVDTWVGTLDAIYSEGVLRGSKNRTLVFDGDDGKESCPDCQRMKGKRRTIKWILENNMIPGPGNTNFECGGWNCAHAWFDPKTGEQVTF